MLKYYIIFWLLNNFFISSLTSVFNNLCFSNIKIDKSKLLLKFGFGMLMNWDVKLFNLIFVIRINCSIANCGYGGVNGESSHSKSC